MMYSMYFNICNTNIANMYFPFTDECVPVGCMMINSVVRLRQLHPPSTLFSLPNAPTLADLDWDGGSTESGKANLKVFLTVKFSFPGEFLLDGDCMLYI